MSALSSFSLSTLRQKAQDDWHRAQWASDADKLRAIDLADDDRADAVERELHPDVMASDLTHADWQEALRQNRARAALQKRKRGGGPEPMPVYINYVRFKSAQAAADALGVARSTIYHAISNGREHRVGQRFRANRQRAKLNRKG